MNQNKPEINYYPPYVPSKIIAYGIYAHEWIILILILSGSMWLFGVMGIVFALMVDGGLWAILVRQDKRNNMLGEFLAFINFSSSQKNFTRKPREEMETSEKEPDKKTPKKKKQEKKQQKKKKKGNVKYMQDFLGFRSIQDSTIYMEDGRVFIFLKIKGNNLNFMSEVDTNALHKELSKEFNRLKFKLSFFMQDALVDIKDNVNFLQKQSGASPFNFIRRLTTEIVQYLNSQKKDAVKKSAFIRIKLYQKDLQGLDVEEITNATVRLFKDTLSPIRTKTEELKQMLAIFSLRLFSDNLPDTEYETVEDYESYLFVKKEKKKKSMRLPGIYTFKDMIAPATASFRPSDATIGSMHVKSYGVSSFLMSTSEKNILSAISTMKGITTSLHLEKLPLSKYRANMKIDMKSKRATSGGDELEAIDADLEKGNIISSYKRIKEDKDEMYYVTVTFTLFAKSKQELEELEAKFKEEADTVGLTVDPLQAMQRDAYETVNPIGTNKLDKYIKQNIPSKSVANLYPFNDPSVIDRHGLPIGNITDRKELVLFDAFENRGANLNILILGYSGVGKTVILWLLLQNALLSGAYIRNIDVEGICVDFTKQLGGINMNMAGNNEYCINPLQIRIPDEVTNGIVDDYISEVKNFIRIYKPDWTGRVLDLFEYFLTKTYESKKIFNSSDLKLLKPEDYPLFSDLVEIVKHEKLNITDNSLGTVEDYDEIILGLYSCTEGADRKLFNRYTNLGGIDDIQLINFDLSEMLNSDLNRRLAQWSNVFTYIGQFVNGNMNRSKRIMVGIDELHTFLKKRYLSIVEILEVYERRFRKYNASFIKATQTAEELDNDDNEMKDKVKTLFSQPSVKFMFHLGDINYEMVQNMMSLKDVEVEKLKEKRQGACLMRINDVVYDLTVQMPEWFREVKHDAKEQH